MVEITGSTQIYGIIADPIKQVRVPQLLNAFIERKELNAVMIPFHTAGEDLAAVIAGLGRLKNLQGLVVTVPHKQSIVALCTHLTPRAQQIGAVNVLYKNAPGVFTGDMLDGVGFVAGMHANDIALTGKHIYLAGAGGAAHAIVFALLTEKVASITLYNRTAAKVDQLIARIAQFFPENAIPINVGNKNPEHSDIVINATSLGLKDGDDYPLDIAGLKPAQLVADIIMSPRETALLQAAKARGCGVHYGDAMLDHQVKLMAKHLGIDEN